MINKNNRNLIFKLSVFISSLLPFSNLSFSGETFDYRLYPGFEIFVDWTSQTLLDTQKS